MAEEPEAEGLGLSGCILGGRGLSQGLLWAGLRGPFLPSLISLKNGSLTLWRVPGLETSWGREHGKAFGKRSEERKLRMCSPGSTCPDPRTAGGDQLFPSPAAPGLLLEHGVSWAELCLRWWLPLPCAGRQPPRPSCPARSTASLGMADGSGKACRWLVILKLLIRDLAGSHQGSAQTWGEWSGGCFLGALYNSSLFSLPPACGPGTFKSKQGEGPCSPCPPNSRTTSGAATVCTCRNGFFRADTDPADSACTSESCPGQGGEARGAVEVAGVCIWGRGGTVLCPHQR